MHFNFHFTAVQILWTLTFAASLVLLVVLLGRERARRYPWFTAMAALAALRLLCSRMLFGRLPQITLGGIFIVLAAVSAVVALLVVAELARRAFGGVRRRTMAIWILAFVVIGGGVAGAWGSWPASWKSISPNSPLATLGLVQLLAQRLSVMVDVLTVGLGVVMVLYGRRYGAGWHSHTQRITIGLSTASISQLGVQAIWQLIARSAVPQSMAEYARVIGIRERLLNGNSAVYIAVLVWWIVCLWIDEPGAARPGDLAALPTGGSSTLAPGDPRKEAGG
ncbi:MAG TPA: hypothetical protein VFI20_03830 [Terracidiphilus sp.]|nr:hypothetical protein [Terracidiphilus sp.]